MADDAKQLEDGFPPKFETVPDLERELDRLTAHQEEVRRKAAYGGMTPEEANEYDIRRMKISRLAERLLQQRTTQGQIESFAEVVRLWRRVPSQIPTPSLLKSQPRCPPVFSHLPCFPGAISGVYSRSI
jgi:hypothetical protein